MRSLSRRDIFPAFGATALAGIAAAGLAKPETLTAAPAAKPEGHSPIIAARNTYQEARALIEAMNVSEPPAAIPGHPDYPAWQKKQDALCKTMWDAVTFLSRTNSKTWFDIKAKSEVANLEFPEYCQSFVMEEDADEVRLAISLINDVTRLSQDLV